MLKKAAVVGHMELVRYLVEAGADIHTEEDYALRYAAKNGHLEVVRFLIENGADVHAENEFALKTAFFKGFKDIVFYLIDRGADIHIEGEVLLRWAAAEGDKNMVRYLIERGANRKEAALQEAVYYNRIETVELLLELGADAKKIDFTETIDFRILSILWRSFSDEEMLPFLVSGNEGLRKAAKKYLERREDGSL
jgi:ankyrin repeat protein